MSKRKQYSKRFKKDAMNLITQEGYKISEAARNQAKDSSIIRIVEVNTPAMNIKHY